MGPRRGGGARATGRKTGGRTSARNQPAAEPEPVVPADASSADMPVVSEVGKAVLEDLAEPAVSVDASVKEMEKEAELSVAELGGVEHNASTEEAEEQPEQRSVTQVTELAVVLEKGNDEDSTKIEDVEDKQDSKQEKEEVMEVEPTTVNESEGVVNLDNEGTVDNPEEDANFQQHQQDANFQQHQQMSERQLRKRLEVFVGGIDKEATEDDIKEAFKEVGEVTEVRLMKAAQTGKSKGYGFVRFATFEQAKRAVSELANAKVRGKTCGVLPSEENDTLFIGNINKAWNKEKVLEKIKELGMENLDELILMEDMQNEGCNRGFAFLGFMTHMDALKAVKDLQQKEVFFGSEKAAKVAWAQPLQEPDEATMAQVKSVFVEGMPPAWDEAEAKEFFGKYGEIERVVLAKNMSSAKRSDYGFINYVNREAALNCIEALKCSEITHGDVKMKLRVVLAKPQNNKGKQFKGTFKAAAHSKQTGSNATSGSIRSGVGAGAGRGSRKPSMRGARGGSGHALAHHGGSFGRRAGYAASNASGYMVSNNLLAMHGQGPEAIAYNHYSEAVRQYGGAVPGMKRPFSAVDDPRYSDIAIRNARSRVGLQGERVPLQQSIYPGMMASAAYVPAGGATLGGLGYGGEFATGMAGSVYGASSGYSYPGPGTGMYY